MKKLFASLLLFATMAAFAATVQKQVTQITWDNPTFPAGVTVASINFVCSSTTGGTAQTGSSSDAAQLTAGSSGVAALSGILKADGSYTCTASYTDTAGNQSPQSGPTEVVTASAGNFTVTATTADAPGSLHFK